MTPFIDFVVVTANMTHFFQPLDLTVNKSAKQFMKNEFITYYSDACRQVGLLYAPGRSWSSAKEKTERYKPGSRGRTLTKL